MQVKGFITPSYYIYHVTHLVIKGGYILIWWTINYTNNYTVVL